MEHYEYFQNGTHRDLCHDLGFIREISKVRYPGPGHCHGKDVVVRQHKSAEICVL